MSRDTTTRIPWLAFYGEVLPAATERVCAGTEAPRPLFPEARETKTLEERIVAGEIGTRMHPRPDR